MEITYKKLYTEEPFKSIEGETIDLSSSILKICADDYIEEVDIDGEKIIKEESSKEVLINKINVSNKSKVKLIVKTIDEELKEKSFSKIITLNKNKYVYDKNKIIQIDKRGKLAYENIKSNNLDLKKDEYESLVEFNKIDGNKVDKFLNDLKSILILSKDISESPKVELIEYEEVKNSNEVKTINSNSARYFSMHPEDWYQSGRNMPKPLKILTSSCKESNDIYENRMFLYVIKKTIEKLKYLKFAISDEKNALYNRINMTERELLYFGNYHDEEMLKKDKDNLALIKKRINKISNIENEIKLVERNIQDIRYVENLKLKMTQKILYDNRYKRIFDFYKEYEDDFTIAEKKEVRSNVDTIYNYLFILAEDIIKILTNLGFGEISHKTSIDYEKLFVNEDKFEITSEYFYDSKFNYKITINSIKNSNPSLILDLEYKGNKKSICMKINTDYKEKGHIIEEKDIERIYEKYYDKNYDTNIVFNTIVFAERRFKDEKTKLKSVFKLSNIGNNYLSKKEYKNYGSFKMAVISYEGNRSDRLRKLFKVLFIKLGFDVFCTECGGNLKKDKNGNLECEICHSKIYIEKCKKCGETNIKFLSKNESSEKTKEREEAWSDLENLKKNIFDYQDKYESLSNNIGACYERFYSNSGGFCSNCGECSRSDGNCIRCSLMEKSENNENNNKIVKKNKRR